MNLTPKASALFRKGKLVSATKNPWAVLIGSRQCPHGRHKTFEEAMECAAAVYESHTRRFARGVGSIRIVQPQQTRWMYQRQETPTGVFYKGPKKFRLPKGVTVEGLLKKARSRSHGMGTITTLRCGEAKFTTYGPRHAMARIAREIEVQLAFGKRK